MMRWSKSSPPKWVSPLVDATSKHGIALYPSKMGVSSVRTRTDAHEFLMGRRNPRRVVARHRSQYRRALIRRVGVWSTTSPNATLSDAPR